MGRLQNYDLGILLLRIGLGIVFIYHGWGKIGAMEQTIHFFGTLGFAPFLAYLVAWVELLGGIALIAGIFMQYAAILLAIVVAVAILKVRLSHGFSAAAGGYEFEFVLFLGSLAMVLMNAGRYSLSKMFGKSSSAPQI